MDAHKLQIILQKHKKWLKNEEGGERANLRSADLSYANLSYANLRYADLSYANLSYANLSYANLRSADLNYANLSYANLRYADLSYANLSYANLRYADLSYANLSYADLRSANLSYADLRSAKNISEFQKAQTQICPQKGTFTAFKKLSGGIIAELKIPAKAKRSNAPGSRKCRASEAKVISFIGGCDDVYYSDYDGTFEYRIGAVVRPKDPFCEDWTKECESGIHFFLSKEEAENY